MPGRWRQCAFVPSRRQTRVAISYQPRARHLPADHIAWPHGAGLSNILPRTAALASASTNARNRVQGSVSVEVTERTRPYGRRRRSMFCWSPAADQATGAGSLTILRLLVDAWSRSIAAARSLGGASVDQRLPTRRTSPRPSRSRSRASAFSLLSPAAREAIAVENELGSPSSAARRRSGRWVVSRSLACGCGAGGSATAHTASAEAGSRPTGGSSPKRARQPAHKTTGSRPAGRTISNPRHFRAERHTPQRRPARSISLTSSVPIGISLQDRTSNRGVSLALRRPDGPKRASARRLIPVLGL